MRCSCSVLLYATKLGGRAGKRTPWGSWSPRTPRTPRVGCVLGARTPHAFLRMIARLDSSKGHLIRNRKIGPGWISYSRMCAFFPEISTYITSPEFIFFRWISACVSCCSFLMSCQYLAIISVDSGYYSLCIFDVCFGSILWILLVQRVLRYSSILVS